MRTRFAVLEQERNKKREVFTARTLEDLVREAEDMTLRGSQLFAVEYRRSGHTELARARDADELYQKLSQKTGVV